MQLWENFLSNPFGLVPVLLACMAAFGFLVYVRGFSGSIKQTLTMNANVEHVKHAYERVLHGFLIILSAFVLWETYRFIAGLIGPVLFY